MKFFTTKLHKLIIGTLVLFIALTINPTEASAQRPGSPKAKAKAHHKKEHRKENHKKAHKKRAAHHHYKHLPRRGVVVKTLPSGVVIVKHKGANLHFHNGVFYKSKGAASFAVVRAPLGVRVKVLPPGHRKIMVKKRAYVYYYGTFYAKAKGSEEYEVVEAPIGAEVDALPEGYEMEEVDGVVYYTLDDVRYMEKGSDEDPVYEVVK